MAKLLPIYADPFPSGMLAKDLPANINKAYRAVSINQN
jgi:hypothetical protein